jgi:hypothetical protein
MAQRQAGTDYLAKRPTHCVGTLRRAGIGYRVQCLGLQMRIAAQHPPILMTRHKRDLLDSKSRLEQAARALMPQIMKVQIHDLEFLADSRKGRTADLCA